MTETEAFKALYDTIKKLRGPDGCPWDREQTPLTLRTTLIEETYECVEAIEEDDPEHITEELGDLFLQAVLLSYIYEEQGKFTTAGVLTKINDKLIRRHPHVFNGLKVKDTNEVLDNWEKIKREQEGKKPNESILDEVSAGFPPMNRAFKLQKKASKTGFDWPDVNGVILKIKEELNEVTNAISEKKEQAIEDELGDLLFCVINLCRYLKVEPSAALHHTNRKFIKRFKYVEKKMKETGDVMKKENLEIMDKYWNESKGEP